MKISFASGPLSFGFVLSLFSLACGSESGTEGGTGGAFVGSGGFTSVGGSAAGGTTASGGASTGGVDGGTATGGGAAGGTTGSGGGSSDGCGITDILPESKFNELFPNRNAAYSYQGMLDALSGANDLIGFPAFATTGDCDTRKREMAAFLANASRETGLFVYIEQINKSFAYCDQSKPYGCPAGTHQYFGRGPIQLSWNYNYRAASLALFGDDRLLQTPSLVATTPAIAWATGFWFWMDGGGNYSPHDAIIEGGGFGDTIQIINGGEECNGGTAEYAEESVSQRVCWYEKYVASFGTTVGPGDLNCNTTVNRDAYCDGIRGTKGELVENDERGQWFGRLAGALRTCCRSQARFADKLIKRVFGGVFLIASPTRPRTVTSPL